jgi:hypothetical protein
MADEGWRLKWELLVADAWDDPDLKKRLLSKPEEVFKERGITLPAGMKAKVVESTEETGYFVIPPKPSEEEMSEEELESVAGGGGFSLTLGCAGGCGCGGGGCRGCAGCVGCRGCAGCRGCGGGGCGCGGGGCGCGGGGCGGGGCRGCRP